MLLYTVRQISLNIVKSRHDYNNSSSFGSAHVSFNIQLLTVDVQYSNRILNCHLGLMEENSLLNDKKMSTMTSFI